MMTKAVPYCAPRVKAFLSKEFTRSNRLALELCGHSALSKVLVRKDVWLCRSLPSRAPRRRNWQPKVYVCVKSRDYWPVVLSLLASGDDLGVRWKFYASMQGPDRPDKIVLYPNDSACVVRTIEKLAPLLSGASTHPLRHAATPHQLGLSAQACPGVYVAADPSFLGISWRLYRAVCTAWLRKNCATIRRRPGGTSSWRRAMNLAAAHEGPLSLNPQGGTRGVRSNWAEVL